MTTYIQVSTLYVLLSIHVSFFLVLLLTPWKMTLLVPKYFGVLISCRQTWFSLDAMDLFVYFVRFGHKYKVRCNSIRKCERISCVCGKYECPLWLQLVNKRNQKPWIRHEGGSSPSTGSLKDPGNVAHGTELCSAHFALHDTVLEELSQLN